MVRLIPRQIGDVVKLRGLMNGAIRLQAPRSGRIWPASNDHRAADDVERRLPYVEVRIAYTLAVYDTEGDLARGRSKRLYVEWRPGRGGRRRHVGTVQYR